jgi:hypothetical protein
MCCKSCPFQQPSVRLARLEHRMQLLDERPGVVSPCSPVVMECTGKWPRTNFQSAVEALSVAI